MKKLPLYIFLFLSLFASCNQKQSKTDIATKLEMYGSQFNSTRDSIGLLPFKDDWKYLPFDGRNAFYVYDQSVVDRISKTTDKDWEKGMYYGKCLFFNDNDSLDMALSSEADIFVIKKKDEFGRYYKNKLSYIYNLKNSEADNLSIGWEYLFDPEIYNADEAPQLKSEYITKSRADSILIAWGITK